MAESPNRYTILGAAEHYRTKSPKKGRWRPFEPPDPQRVAKARENLSPKIDAVVSTLQTLPAQRILEEVVLELRLDDKFLAKSHVPEDLLTSAALTIRGTGTWQQYEPSSTKEGSKKSRDSTGESRSLFVSGSQASLAALTSAVKRGVSEEVDADIIKLEDIRLPTAQDRLEADLRQVAGPTPIEMVLFEWTATLRQAAIDRIDELFYKHQVPESRVRRKSYNNGPTFIAAVVPPQVIEELGECNFLRSARLLPRIQLADEVVRHGSPQARIAVPAPAQLPRIAIFDGGYSSTPLLDPYVRSFDLTSRPPDPFTVEHGTMVASAAVYGPLDVAAPLPSPLCQVLSYRVLPDSLGDDALEMYGVIDAIEEQIPLLPADVRVCNISLGPPGPISTLASRFTYALDRLAREHDKLFVTAVGNWGQRPGKERIQAPSDSINNLSAGAFRLNSAMQPEIANYQSIGPGRPGGAVKPDILAFGGCRARTFNAILPGPAAVGGSFGTSLAAPVLSSTAARVIAAVGPQSTLSPEAVRALLLHSAKPILGAPVEWQGHGALAGGVEEILACSPKRVSVLYQGTISPRDSWKLPFLLPLGFDPGGRLRFEWIVVYSPDVQQGRPDEYSLAGIVVGFRPHSDIYTFAPPKGSRAKPVDLNVQQQATECRRLVREGWKQGLLPKSDSRPGQSEAELRGEEGKWETVVRSDRGKTPGSVSEPMLTIQVHGRGPWDKEDPALSARYAAILTVEAPKYNGDLYAAVMQSWNKLVPLVRAQPQSRLRT